MKKGILPFFVIGLMAGSAWASKQEELPPLVSQWDQALDSYRQKDFAAAAIHLQKVIQQDTSAWESAAWLMLSRSYLQMNTLGPARQAAEKLIAKYPYGRYAPYGHYVLAQIDFQQQRFMAAALELLAAAENTRDDDLNLLARSKLERLYEIYLTNDQKETVLDHAEAPVIQAELAAVLQGYRLPIRVGVILQLSGTRADEGQHLLAGIEQAAAEARRRHRVEVEIISRDSRGDVVEAVRAAKSLIGEDGVLALIGDLEGACSAAIAAVASERGVPLVIPTGQDVGLAEIGDQIFQLLPDYSIEGAAAANYALKNLSAHAVAILAPASDEGTARVQGFKDAFLEGGGSISVEQWYYQETTNFNRQLAAISRTQGAEPETPVDPADTLEHPLGMEVLPDSVMANRPINAVDAIYVPVQAEEIALLAPQLAAAGFQKPLIGDTNCLDLVGRESIKRYVADMIFPANYSSVAGVDLDSDFAHLYQSRTGAWPDRWSLLGWDAFNYLSQGLKDTGAKTNSKKVVDRLAAVHRFTGARAEMFFPQGERVNHSLFILNYTGGQLQMLQSPHDAAQDMGK